MQDWCMCEYSYEYWDIWYDIIWYEQDWCDKIIYDTIWYDMNIVFIIDSPLSDQAMSIQHLYIDLPLLSSSTSILSFQINYIKLNLFISNVCLVSCVHHHRHRVRFSSLLFSSHLFPVMLFSSSSRSCRFMSCPVVSLFCVRVVSSLLSSSSSLSPCRCIHMHAH